MLLFLPREVHLYTGTKTSRTQQKNKQGLMSASNFSNPMGKKGSTSSLRGEINLSQHSREEIMVAEKSRMGRGAAWQPQVPRKLNF